MQQYLFIGVGGSGGKTLRYLWRELDRHLRANGWSEPYLPRCFGFLHIDLPFDYDGNAETDIPVNPDLATSFYFGLGSKDIPYSTYDGQLAKNDRIEGFTRWRPWDPKRIPQPGKGAGQRRAVGRVVSVVRLADISRRVTASMDALFTGHAQADLATLAELMPNGSVYTGDGHVVLIGSLAGGAGSGIFL
ncbi:MAG: tubulin-like doman-containing protein, partial [Acidimicrobiales bacterium]